jgi:two-component system osmolarity sensor histidine kinase EnvZ
MDRMLGEFLAFARGDSLEATVPVDPFSLAAGVAEDARRAGASVELLRVDENGGDAVPLRPLAVGRALQNLVGNAARHGTHVLLTVREGPRWLVFAVEDDGPGIPEADRARALQPFTRLDAARPSNPAGPGVGLGLTIALDVARSHGGTLELGESPGLGGLKATLRLPR